MSRVRRVLVVGGGVGGLTAATAFAQRGVEVVLIERRPAFDIPGVGLGQPANALRIYDALGVLPDILSSGFSYDHMSIFDPNRELIVRHKFLLGDQRIPPFCALSRLRLHEILLGAAQRAGVEVRCGLTASEIHQDDDGVTVDFSNGQTGAFDLLAGFDGIRSATRMHLVGTAFAPRPSGYGAWRLQVPRPDYVQGMEFLQGVGSKAGAMPLADDLMYLFHIRPEATGRRVRARGLPGAAARTSRPVRRLRCRDPRVARCQLGHRLQPDRAHDAAVALVPRSRRHRRRRRACFSPAPDAGARRWQPRTLTCS